MTASTEDLMQTFDARVARRESRRAFFTAAVSAGAIGAGAFAFATAASAQTVTEADVLNFALNLEYLEANFYSFAVNGTAIPAESTGGTGIQGVAYGGQQVRFTDRAVRSYAREIAADELAHVNFLRATLGTAAVAQPRIDVGTSPAGAFSNAARAAGLIGPGQRFNPYSSDENFLLGSFIFEDVGVTAYKGSVGLLNTPAYIDAAAGIHAAEAYHAAIVRTTLYAKGIRTLISSAGGISDARDSLDGSTDLDQGIQTRRVTVDGYSNGQVDVSNIAPTDPNGIPYSRSAAQVLNIVYLTSDAVTAGGFFPRGVNGTIKTSAASTATNG